MVTLMACQQGTKPTTNTLSSAEQPVYVYSFDETGKLSTDNTKALAAKFLATKDEKGFTFNQDNNTMYYVDGSDANITLEQDLTNGNFSFSKIDRRYMGDYVPALPSSEEAIKIGAAFLREHGLQANNENELQLEHVGGLRAQSQKGKIIDKVITLTYGRKLDSLPVIGPGSKIVINIGDKGEVVGLTRRWREVSTSKRTMIKTTELMSAEEAEAVAKKQITAEFGEKATFELKSAEKAYYDNNGKILQPVYVFETVVDLHDKSIQPTPYLCIIPMLRNSPEPLNLTAVDPKALETLKANDPAKVDTTATPSRDVE